MKYLLISFFLVAAAAISNADTGSYGTSGDTNAVKTTKEACPADCQKACCVKPEKKVEKTMTMSCCEKPAVTTAE
jgi:hypothetical protein